MTSAFELIVVLVPGSGARTQSGGLGVSLQAARLLQQLRPTEVVTYRYRQQGYMFIDDILGKCSKLNKILWIVSWGFDAPDLFRKLKDQCVAYYAHSCGYGFNLPLGIPVFAVSRNTLGYWGDRSPRNPLFLLPNALESKWIQKGVRNKHELNGDSRSIDVLVQKRKTSSYVLNKLVPALRSKGLRVEVQSGWVEDLVDLFNSSTVYLYDSADYWKSHGLSEGFGLPPFEALACGCVVFTSFNHALADLLIPGETAHQIGRGSLEYDVSRIVKAVAKPSLWRMEVTQLNFFLDQLSESSQLKRWSNILLEIEDPSFPLWRGECFLRSPSKVELFLKTNLKRILKLVFRNINN